MNLDLRPMSTSQVLDRTFWLYRRNFWLFAGIAALPPALGFVAQLAILVFPRIFSNSTREIPVLSIGIGVILFALLYLVGYALATGASVYAVSNTHLGKPITIAEAYAAVGDRVVAILLTGLLMVVMFAGMAIGFALVFGAVAGVASMLGLKGIVAALLTFVVVMVEVVFFVWIFLRLSLVVPVCVLEKLGAVQSLKRSFSLARGTAGRLLIVILLSSAVTVALVVVFSIPFFIGAALSKGEPAIQYQVIQQFAGFLAGTLGTPISLIAFVMVYYDQRVRKEAFDLTLMMEAIGQAPPPKAMETSAGSPNSIG